MLGELFFAGVLLQGLVGLERELELERRKNRDVQAVSREKDKEYQKLKVRASTTNLAYNNP